MPRTHLNARIASQYGLGLNRFAEATEYQNADDGIPHARRVYGQGIRRCRALDEEAPMNEARLSCYHHTSSGFGLAILTKHMLSCICTRNAGTRLTSLGSSRAL